MEFQCNWIAAFIIKSFFRVIEWIVLKIMSKERSEIDKDAILSFIEKNGVFDKDTHQTGRKSFGKQICRKHSVRVVLDLHGMKCEEAARKVKAFLSASRDRGIREVLIIHGKGNHVASQNFPVLKKMVRDMLDSELCHTIRDYRTALPKEGGEGATLVYLY